MSNTDDEPLSERLLIEIEAWDFALFVGLSPDYVPAEARFQGGLGHSNSLILDGRMLAPGKYAGGRGFGGHLRIPAADMPIAATALASVWKYIHVYVTDTGEDHERVTMFSFDRDLHPNVADWAASTQVEGA